MNDNAVWTGQRLRAGADTDDGKTTLKPGLAFIVGGGLVLFQHQRKRA